MRKAINEVTATVEKNARKAAKATQAVVDQANKAAGQGKKKKSGKSSKKKSKK